MTRIICFLSCWLFVVPSAWAQELRCGNELIKTAVISWIQKNGAESSWAKLLRKQSVDAESQLFTDNPISKRIKLLEIRKNDISEKLPEVGQMCSRRFEKEIKSFVRGHPLAAYCGRYTGTDMIRHVRRERENNPDLHKNFEKSEILTWINENIIPLVIEYENLEDTVRSLEYQREREVGDGMRKLYDPNLRILTLNDIRTTLLNKEIGRLECLANFRDTHSLLGIIEMKVGYQVSVTDEGKYYLTVDLF